MAKHRKQRFKDQAPISLNITGLNHEGRGIAQLNGKIVFVHGALPGETVQVQLKFERKTFCEGVTLAVIANPSPHRALPACPAYEQCGGCSLQHISSAAQIEHKQQVLLELLNNVATTTPQYVLPPLTAATTAYRHKARLGVRYVHKKEKVLVGFREKFSNFITDITHCPVLHHSIGQRIEALAHLIQSLDGYCDIPQIEVAIGNNIPAIVLRHLKPLSEADMDSLITFFSHEKIHLYLQPGNNQTIHCIWPDKITNRLTYRLPHYDLTMQFHPIDFVQINPSINEQMLDQVIQLMDIQANDRIVDFFCGLGNFTLPLARFASQVIGIEGCKDMVERATNNAMANHINNTVFQCHDLYSESYQIDPSLNTFNKCLIDPPRSGAIALIKQLTAMNFEKIIYVSCNPSTLARDAAELIQQGYHLSHAGIMDMFPHTGHVESMAIFVRKPNH